MTHLVLAFHRPRPLTHQSILPVPEASILLEVGLEVTTRRCSRTRPTGLRTGSLGNTIGIIAVPFELVADWGAILASRTWQRQQHVSTFANHHWVFCDSAHLFRHTLKHHM